MFPATNWGFSSRLLEKHKLLFRAGTGPRALGTSRSLPSTKSQPVLAILVLFLQNSSPELYAAASEFNSCLQVE